MESSIDRRALGRWLGLSCLAAAAGRSLPRAAAAEPQPAASAAMPAPSGEAKLRIGMVIYNGMTTLDFAGPDDVFARPPGTKTYVLAKNLDPVVTDSQGRILPDLALRDAPELDVLFIGGGGGVAALMEDGEVLDFFRARAGTAKWVTSVCTGALVLGAAGLLRGYKAVTHWSAMEYLSAFGAIPTKTRVCIDRNRVTGGGVTAGIDFALTLVSIMVDRRTAEAIQLRLEYNPSPPFNSGSPDTAPSDVLALINERIAPSRSRRGQAIQRAAARLTASA